MNKAKQVVELVPWHEANLRYLHLEIDRLRLLLRRYALWVRHWAASAEVRDVMIGNAEADHLLASSSLAQRDRFWCEDHEANILSEQAAAMAETLANLRRNLAEAGPQSPLDVLTGQFGLTSFERDVLLLALAPELDPGFQRLYGYLHDDAGRQYLSAGLAINALTHGGDEWLPSRDSLLAFAPLRRYRLIHMPRDEAPLPLRRLRLDERLTNYMLGVNRLDESLERKLRESPPALLASAASHQVDCLEQWARARIRNGKWPALHLVGPPGAGKGASARALCDRLGLKLFVLDPAVLELTPADLDEFLPTIDRDGILLEFAVYCDLTKIELNGPPGAAAVAAQRFNRLGILRIAGSRNPLGLDDALSVSITKPDAAAQSALWRVALNGSATALSGRIDLLVQQFDFGPQQIAEAAAATRESLELSHPLDDDTGAEALLWQSCRARAGNRLEDLAQRIQPAFGWDDIVVADDVMGQLREIAAQVELRPLVYGRWGFGERLSRGRGITALFAGPSGTGKTMAAEVLANALRLDLYRVDLASVVSKYIGETEKNLRRIFDAAEDGGVILFFDEADALFGKRSDVKDSHDRYANIEISYLLQRMEAYQGLAVLATNMKAILDQAFFRRIRFVVNFPFPDATQRAEIWRRMFPATAPTYGLELARLSRLNVAGGSIRNIALNAAFLAAKADQPICMTHVLEAARAEYAKLEKPLTDAEFRGCI